MNIYQKDYPVVVEKQLDIFIKLLDDPEFIKESGIDKTYIPKAVETILGEYLTKYYFETSNPKEFESDEFYSVFRLIIAECYYLKIKEEEHENTEI